MSSNHPPETLDEKTPLLGVDSMEKSDMNGLEHQEISEKKGMTKNKLLVVVCILMCELCERLTYYSCVANLVLYCTSKLELPTSTATTVSLIFSGTVFIIPVFGGYIADTIAGKYNTILGAGLIYLLGLFLLPASAVDYSKWFGQDDEGASYDMTVETRKNFFFSGLVFIALGTGGIKANVGPFGAQQVDDMGPEAVQSFFNWFYWFINAGALVAYSGVAYIQQNISFEIGFLIPLVSMVVALILFVVAKSQYVITQPGGSILQDSVGVCMATKCRGFDKARGPYSNDMVDGVIAVLRILPVFLLIIIYWAIYSQMQSSFFLQSERMNIYIGDAKMPAALLNIFNTIIILILIPIMDRIVYPFLAKINRSPSHLQRIGVGFILATLSVVVAGILEIYRKKNLASTGGVSQDLAGDTFNASTISFFAQVPEFALVGASEVFTSISGLEFAYSQAPDFMQGVCMGLFLMMSGLGNYVSEAILKFVRAATGSEPPDSWFPDEINEGKTEYLFFLLGILMFVDFVIFVFVAKCYKYRKTQAETYEAAIVPEKQGIPENQAPPGYDNFVYADENYSTKF
ncbi:solute carrier family 15 (peptide/histidine transporter), member 3/4 [Mytilus galloprovincialis]|uniref:Solute carrier family 15 (Peptide/histidine transporter), member 3/4 n=2 Tax=Mytilus galloprovincialis TaxID=29158 RepID=A0A8B6BVD4_MYTGA|nr:solute carrier family 15 (peptide/histidine transporter), member 3/4 [Mytilus galloprovincialis]